MHVYFYIRDDVPAKGMMPYYQHEVVVLGEGFTEMGISCFGNVNYWITEISEHSPQYLIRQAPLECAHTAKVVFIGADYPLPLSNDNPPNPIPSHSTVPVVYVARTQVHSSYVLRAEFLDKFDFVLLCDYNRAYSYPQHVRPWVFGLTNRIIRATKNEHLWTERRKSVIWNFRCSHSSRSLAESRIKPILEKNNFSVDTSHSSKEHETWSEIEELYFKQTNWRHYPSYYKKLCSQMICASFGGFFDIAILGYHYSFINRIGSKLLRTFSLSSTVLRQHDSWRIWESWAAGCVMLCADLEKCNVLWPVMPKNYVHYVGVTPLEFLFPHSFEKKFLKFHLENIAHAGREFALKYYTPFACAQRALRYIGIS